MLTGMQITVTGSGTCAAGSELIERLPA